MNRDYFNLKELQVLTVNKEGGIINSHDKIERVENLAKQVKVAVE